MRKLFLPGYGATGRLYARGLEEGWQALEPPPFHATNGALASYVDWVRRELRRNDRPIWLAGHSMGGALAMLATTADPRRVARLTLVSPAGLPLRKPIPASLVLFATQVARRRYGFDEIRREVGQALRAPRAALRLAQAVRRLDLTSEMRSLRASGVPVEVVGCSTDSLVTPAHCREVASILGADYRELELAGGHMWMLTAWPVFSELL
ncbi:MAG TPA: alpha/beta fold hydrolase [Gaiellaceae bacterium]|nr:alpha/beta fold hydrolase [Gaiellaceae bacterium]